MKKLLLLTCFAPALLQAQNSESTAHYPKFGRLNAYPITCSYQVNSSTLRGSGFETNEDSTEHSKKFVRFISINVYSGVDVYRDGYEDRTLFQQAAPTSTLAFGDMTGYSNNDNFLYTSLSVTSGVNVNLHLRCQERFGELRFGISHTAVNVSSQYYYQENTTTLAVDTLTNGDILITDSTARSSYNFNWNSDILHLQLGWIVRTDPKRWVSVYTGFSLFGGVGYNGTISATHMHQSREHISFQYASQGGGLYSGDTETQILVEEQFRAPSFCSIGASIPIGFSVRLGRRNPFMRHLALFGEYNGSVQLIIPKGTDSKIRTVSSMYGGVRWTIHAPKGKRNGHGKGHHGHHHHNHADDSGQPKVD